MSLSVCLMTRDAEPNLERVLRSVALLGAEVIVADTGSACPIGGMSGSDPTITIPSVRITKTDGTQYFFGLNRLPGWASGNANTPETSSVFTVPVYGNNSGEPCYQATFAASPWDEMSPLP